MIAGPAFMLVFVLELVRRRRLREDYSLLFTASKEMGWLDSFATQIGICTAGTGVKVQLAGTEIEGLEAGFDHFA